MALRRPSNGQRLAVALHKGVAAAMLTIRNVLVAIDLRAVSPGALEFARYLSDVAGAPLHLLHVTAMPFGGPEAGRADRENACRQITPIHQGPTPEVDMSHTRNVRDVMSPDIMTVADDMTTDELARYLIEREISGAPVVDSQGHLIGVVSMTDLGRNMAEPPDIDSSGRSGFYRDVAADLTLEDLGQRYVEERAVPVRDVMTPVIHQVPVTASVAEAARLMVNQHIHRLVVTQGKEPVGIITSLDLLKVLAREP